jgi:hypothetical protein
MRLIVIFPSSSLPSVLPIFHSFPLSLLSSFPLPLPSLPIRSLPTALRILFLDNDIFN